jgi:hypothetical protein
MLSKNEYIIVKICQGFPECTNRTDYPINDWMVIICKMSDLHGTTIPFSPLHQEVIWSSKILNA